MVRDGDCGLARNFDLVQSRYGWTDENVNSLPFSRFMRLVQLLGKVKQEEAKEKLVLAAFTSWQLGAGNKRTLGEYLEHLGLSDKAPQQRRGKDAQKKEEATLSRMGIKVKKVKK